jgi:hypothetical protein
MVRKWCLVSLPGLPWALPLASSSMPGSSGPITFRFSVLCIIEAVLGLLELSRLGAVSRPV